MDALGYVQMSDFDTDSMRKFCIKICFHSMSHLFEWKIRGIVHIVNCAADFFHCKFDIHLRKKKKKKEVTSLLWHGFYVGQPRTHVKTVAKFSAWKNSLLKISLHKTNHSIVRTEDTALVKDIHVSIILNSCILENCMIFYATNKLKIYKVDNPFNSLRTRHFLVFIVALQEPYGFIIPSI